MARARTASSEYDDAPTTTPGPLPSASRIKSWRAALFADEDALRYKYLVEERGLDPDVIDWCGMGWDSSASAYAIPLYNEKKVLENVRWWRPGGWSSKSPGRDDAKGRKKMWFLADRRTLFLWPTYDLSKRDLVLVCEGEVDAMTLISHGYAAVTSTGGAGKWDQAWGRFFAKKEVIIVADLDPDGRIHMQIVKESVLPHAHSVRILNWGDLL